ncbi:MAG: putative Methionyl-tRNA formyltransferase [Conexibacter sp.]|nr:putative Methionyl-tRNA formyltransferase [Conexibacter sp.]
MSAAAPRILFIGGTRRGHRVLEAMVAQGEPLVAVYGLQQDEHELDRFDDAVAATAARAGLPCTMGRRIGPDEERQIVEVHRPDLIVLVGWRTMVPMSVVRSARLGCVAAHDSLLPRGRGFAPTNWTIILGHETGGVTLFHMEDEVDAGDVVGQAEVPVGPRTTAPELYEVISDATLDLVLEHLPGLKAGTAPRSAQDHARATFFCARTPADGTIDWSASTAVVDRLIRGLAHPYPGARTSLDGEELVVWDAEPLADPPRYEGRVAGRPVARHHDGAVDVLTGDGVLRVRRVGRAGEALPAADVIRSLKATLGR